MGLHRNRQYAWSWVCRSIWLLPSSFCRWGAEQSAVRLLFDGTEARWAARDFDLASHLQYLAVEAQHVERLIEHGLRQQRLAVPAPDHPLTPASHLRLGREGELASFDAVDHD